MDTVFILSIYTAMDCTVSLPPTSNSYSEALRPNVMVIEDVIFGR